MGLFGARLHDPGTAIGRNVEVSFRVDSPENCDVGTRFARKSTRMVIFGDNKCRSCASTSAVLLRASSQWGQGGQGAAAVSAIYLT